MGVQDDVYFLVDSIGMELGGGGLNIMLCDLVCFGEMICNDGCFNGKQILFKSVIEDICCGGDFVKFVKVGYMMLFGYLYCNMWWVLSNDYYMFEVCGIYGQCIYIDLVVQMMIVCYVLYLIVVNVVNDLVMYCVYVVLVEYFM